MVQCGDFAGARRSRNARKANLVSTTSPDAPVARKIADLAVVIPCYNAGDKVRDVVRRTVPVAGRVWVVDDGSTDGGVAGIEDLGVEVIVFARNQGKGAALLAGFKAALARPETTCIAVVDADGQHDPGEIPALYAAFNAQHADLLIGARTFEGGAAPWASRIGNEVTRVITRWLFRRPLPDTQSGFRLLSRRFAEAVVATVPPGRYETEMAILIKALREDYVLTWTPIRTIYEPGNASSHFRKIRDSLRIYRTLAGAALRKR